MPDSASPLPPSTRQGTPAPPLPPLFPCLASHPTSNLEPTRAILVAVDFGKHDLQEDLNEPTLLAPTAGSKSVRAVTGKRSRPDAILFIGADKAEEVKVAADGEDAGIVIFNHALSPAQWRNPRRLLGHHVVDRTGLILDIFSQHAQNHVGKVQVELARVRHQVARLVRAWSHLERQKDSIDLRGGPDERQLEPDRRMLDERAKRLSSELGKFQRQHDTQHRSHSRDDTFSAPLVGYTDAGKSTLFNALTKAHAYTTSRLFATPDTTSRRLYLEGLDNVVLSDAADFIRNLLTQLVTAFRAALGEIVHADVLLHVVDAANTAKHEQMEQVDRVLDEIDISGIPQILVMNKIGVAEGLRVVGPHIERGEIGTVRRAFIFVIGGIGFDLLREALAETVTRLCEHSASYGSDLDPRFDTRRDSSPTHRDELSQSLPSSGSSAKSDEEG